MISIYHNPRCSKSRQTLAILQENSQDFEIVDYLKTPPTNEQLRSVLSKLGMKPIELIRKNEALFKQKYKGSDLNDDEWITVMVNNPILIERPIVVNGDKAVLGRPPENIKQLL